MVQAGQSPGGSIKPPGGKTFFSLTVHAEKLLRLAARNIAPPMPTIDRT
jgi:hypothetical protein